MRRSWWKVLSVALLLFASITALRTPLSPAIVDVSPDRIKAGEVSIDIAGYNTHFTKGDPQAWLLNSDQCVQAVRSIAKDDAHLTATFQVPAGARKELTSLVIISATDGKLVLHDAFWTDDRGNGMTDAPCAMASKKSLDPGFVFPNRNILYETIRNLNFHVPMWFTMIVLMGISFVFSLKALQKNDLDSDMAAAVAAKTGLFFCCLGLITGSIWARFTWGTWWTSDVKLNGAAVGALIYAAYLVLRGSVPEAHKRMRLAGVYNIFAFALLIVLLFVLPRLNAVDSLHPGNGGNPAFSNYDLDNRLRLVFYPAVFGWIGMGVWMFTLGRRLARLETRFEP